MADSGVIFDMDGVLVDSYAAHWESWRQLGQTAGFDMTEAQFVATFGRTSREIIAEFWPHLATTRAQVAALDQQKEELFRAILAADFPAMDGAVELVDALHAAGFALAVGSSGPPENVALVLDKLKRQKKFAAVVTGMDVTRGKPNPQVFQLAVQQIGLAASRCLVIEDAPSGVAAAKAAGMKCIGLASTGRDPRSLRQADRVVSSLREVSADGIARIIAVR
jgi:beta-phosphoglucomutase